jgi:hypothetical protein
MPAEYPFPLCPWHFAPGRGIVKALFATAIFAAGIGGTVAVNAVRSVRKREQTEREQDRWRQNSEELRRPKPPDADGGEPDNRKSAG